MVKRLLSLFLIALPLFADSPRLVPITDAAVASNSSNPRGFVRVGSIVFFYATDGAHGYEIWRTDGTSDGTFLLRDFREGPDSSFVQFVGSAGNLALLLESKSNGDKVLWSSDGTVAGTQKLAEIAYGGNGFSVEVIPADTRVFVVVHTGTGAAQLWTSDLTPGSFRRVGNYPISYSPHPAGASGRLFFPAASTATGQQLWVSDGTAMRTHVLDRRSECPGPACGLIPESIFRLNGAVCFLTKDAMWRTDGTPSGTQRVLALDEPRLAAISPSVVYLITGTKFWRTDGSSTGTRAAGTYDAQPGTHSIVLDDGRLLLVASANGRSTFLLNPGDGTDPVEAATSFVTVPVLGVLGNRVFFGSSSQPGTDVELWTLDVDARTQALVKDIDPRQGLSGPESSSPEYGIALDGRVLFSARTLQGRELWSTDGTAEGTALLKNINPDEQGGIVTGRILDAAGAPIANAFANLCRTENECENFARVDAEGRFRFEGIVPGDYAIAASHAQYVTQFYDRVDCPCAAGSAKRIQVTAGFETAGIEFALKKGGVISGTVRRATGEPFPGAVIVVRNAQGDAVTQAYPDEKGAYSTRGLARGQYWVEAHATYRDGLIDQIHPSRNCIPAPCTIEMGQPVAVEIGGTVANIDFALQEYKTISGTVRTATGEPAESATVEFMRDGRVESSVTTGANGVYRSDALAPGSYSVRVPPSELYEGVVYPNAPCPVYDCTPAGTAISLGAEHVTGIDLVTTRKGARISGVIRDRNGAPYANIRVMLLDKDGYYAGSFGSGETNADGRYVLNLVPPGRYWLLAHDELYPGVDCFAINPCSSMQGATPIDVTEGNTTTVNMQLRSERMSISGRLVDAKTGASIEDSTGLWLLSAATGKWVPSTHEDVIPAVPGAYKVTFITRENAFYVIAAANGWHRTAYPDRKLTCDDYTLCAPPGSIAVGPGNKSGIDITMMPKGIISGSLTFELSGKPIEGAVVLFSKNGVVTGNTYTDETGRYRWPYADGAYNVHIEPYWGPQFIAQVYPNRDCTGACDPKTGTPVTAADGSEVSNVDFRVKSLVSYGSIAGRVVDAETGAGLPDVYVEAWNGATSHSVRTDAQGHYTIDDDVESGDYRLYAEAELYYLSVYGGNHCPDFYACDKQSGALVRVNGTNQTGGVDFRMVRPRIKSVAPQDGPPEGGTRIVITGAQFTPDAKVKVGDAEAQIVSVTPSEIVVITPPGPVGPAHVTVITSQQHSATLTHAYTYTSTSPRRRNSRH